MKVNNKIPYVAWFRRVASLGDSAVSQGHNKYYRRYVLAVPLSVVKARSLEK